MSALALADAAGLSMNMVRFAERGLRVPRVATLRRIARQLDLSRAESDKLIRLAALARAPAADQDALTGPSIPGLVLWKYLPEALYRVDHELLGLAPANPDRLYVDVCSAAAALLAWEALVRQPPTAAQRKALIRQIDDAAQTRPANLPQPVTDLFCTRDVLASATAPHVWRTLLFGTRRDAARAVHRLRRWSYYIGISNGDRAAASFVFRDAAVNAACGVAGVSIDALTSVTDALILDTLWTSAGLAEWAGGPPDYGYYVHPGAIRSLGLLYKMTPESMRADLAKAERDPRTAAVLPFMLAGEYLRTVGDFLFLCERFPRHPRVATAFCGEGWSETLAKYRPRALELERVLREEVAARRAAAASRPQPPTP